MYLLSPFKPSAEAWVARHQSGAWEALTALARQVEADISEDGDGLLDLDEAEVQAAHACVRGKQATLASYTAELARGQGWDCYVKRIETHRLLRAAVRLSLLLAIIDYVTDWPEGVPADFQERCVMALDEHEPDTLPYERLLGCLQRALHKPRMEARDVEAFWDDVAKAGEAIQGTPASLFSVFT